MALANFIHLSHIADNISDERILVKFKEKYQKALQCCSKEMSITRINGCKSSSYHDAVLSGMNADFRMIMSLGTVLKEDRKNVYVQLDVGDPRDDNGRFLHTRSAIDLCNLKLQFGLHHKYINVFPKWLSEKLIPKFVKLGSNTCFVRNPPLSGTFDLDELYFAGTIDCVRPVSNDSKKQVTMFQLRSPLSLFQFIVALQGRDYKVKEGNDKCKFELYDNNSQTTLSGVLIQSPKTGFGIDGEILDINTYQLEGGCVPLNKLSNLFIKKRWISGLEVKCWKCKARFNVEALDAFLQYFAAHCQCKMLDIPSDKDYENYFEAVDRETRRKNRKTKLEEDEPWTEEEFSEDAKDTDEKRRADKILTSDMPAGDSNNSRTAIRLGTENFTRVAFGHNVSSGQLEIVYQPLPMVYKDARTCRRLVQPLLLHQKHELEAIYRANKIVGASVSKKFDVEKNGLDSNTIGLVIRLPSKSFWQPEENLIPAILINMIETKNGVRKAVFKECEGQVFSIEKSVETGYDYLTTQISLSNEFSDYTFEVDCTPKPNTLEFSALQKIFDEEWLQTNRASNHIRKIIFGEESERCYEKPEYDQNSDHFDRWLEAAPLNLIQYIKGLNQQQKEALQKAALSNASVLIGPPGTGKTFTSAMILCVLASVEKKKKIIACSASNYASQNLAAALQKEIKALGLNIRVLRMLSQEQVKKNKKSGINDLETEFHDLHKEVERLPAYIDSEPSLRDWKEDILAGRMHLLPNQIAYIFRGHVRSLQYQVMQGYDIYVTTVQKLSDGIIKDWSNIRDRITDEKINHIGTMLIDEAAQLTMASSLNALSLETGRIIFVGDHRQLRAIIKSYSADLAGYGRSVQECLYNRKSTIPTTELVYQYRMAPHISQLVSELQYNGKLEDGDNVKQRNNKLLNTFMTNVLMQKEGFSELVMFDHTKKETNVDGKGYLNLEEGIEIVKMVAKLIDHGVPPENIVILSMYKLQLLYMERLLNEKGLGDVTVQTVDSYQGRECMVVILSLTRGGTDTRGNFNGSVGFLSDPTRLNVACSRAMELLFIYGNMANLRQSKSDVITLFVKLICKLATIITIE